MRPSKPLRDELRGAINQRKASLRNGRSQRKDQDQVWVSIGKAEAWLSHFPVAKDQSVRDWCLDNREHVSRIVIGHNNRQLQRLLMDALKPKKAEPKVIEMKPTTIPAA